MGSDKDEVNIRFPELHIRDIRNDGIPSGLCRTNRGLPILKNMEVEEIAAHVLNWHQYSTKRMHPSGFGDGFLPDPIRDELLDPETDVESPFEIGIPDLLVWPNRNPSRYFFVEVKSEDDSLRASQVRWFDEYTMFDAFIGYLNLDVIKTTEGEMKELIGKMEAVTGE